MRATGALAGLGGKAQVCVVLMRALIEGGFTKNSSPG